MPVGLAYAVGTALCYGVGSVLQAVAAADAEPAIGLDPRLLLALLRSWRYPAGLVLDTAGFVLSLVALRTLPLYVVQSVGSSFLAVTAVVGVLVLGLRMRRLEVAALVVVVLGLTLVGLSSAPEAAHVLGTTAQWLLLVAAAVLVVVSVPLAAHEVVAGERAAGGRASAWVLGGAGGLAFGLVAVAARALSASMTRSNVAGDVRVLLAAPASYAVLVATPLALVAYATALQRGTVVQATAPLVVGETVLPAVAGLALLGDQPRPGWAAPAALGFVLAVGAAVTLSRFGDVAPQPHRRSDEPAGGSSQAVARRERL